MRSQIPTVSSERQGGIAAAHRTFLSVYPDAGSSQ